MIGVGLGGRHESGVIDGVIGNDGDSGTGTGRALVGSRLWVAGMST